MEAQSCLKQKEFDLNIKDSQQKIEMNYFSHANAPKRQKARDEHYQSILKQFNTRPDQMQVDEDSKNPTNDVHMQEDAKAGEENKGESEAGGDLSSFRKANLLKFRQQQNKAKLDVDSIFEGVEGFKMVGNQKKLEVKMGSLNS